MKRTREGQIRYRQPTAVVLGLVLLMIAEAAAAQVYKWKDEHGTVHYSDTPPPAGPAQVMKTDAPPPPPARPVAKGIPYELAHAMQTAPVVLYTMARCAPCDLGRALLRGRGIPYEERTIDSAQDAKQLHQVNSGKDDLPVLLIGQRKLTGYQAAAWQEALSNAAYPRQKMLPPGYQYAPPVSAAAAPPTT